MLLDLLKENDSNMNKYIGIKSFKVYLIFANERVPSQYLLLVIPSCCVNYWCSPYDTL